MLKQPPAIWFYIAALFAFCGAIAEAIEPATLRMPKVGQLILIQDEVFLMGDNETLYSLNHNAPTRYVNFSKNGNEYAILLSWNLSRSDVIDTWRDSRISGDYAVRSWRGHQIVEDKLLVKWASCFKTPLEQIRNASPTCY